jgi:hypothetical protein
MALGQSLGSLVTGMSVDDAIESYLARLADTGAPASPTSAQEAARAQSEAIVEIMFLVAAVDGEVAALELELLRKNVRELAESDVLASVDADALVPALEGRLAREGWSERMHAATAVLVAPDVRRLAYRLGAGVAFVDDRVEAAEAAALDALAKTFELADDDAHAILVEVQKTLFG